MGATRAVRLDPARRGSAVQKLEDGLRHYLIGQDDAIDAITDSYQMYCAGLTDGNRPVSNMLFCGPTGTGKTFTAEMVAREIAGTKEALVKIDCAEFQHSHEIAKLVGCFVPDTKIQLGDGSVKRIADIKVGDSVRTKNGRNRPVTFLHKYSHNGQMIEIHTSNSNTPIVCTPTHKILAIPVSVKGRLRNPKSLYDPTRLQWIPASDIKKQDVVVYARAKDDVVDRTIDLTEYSKNFRKFTHNDTHVWAVGQTVRTPRYLAVDYRFARLAGYYVSEGGNSRDGKSINFTFSKEAKDAFPVWETVALLRELFGGNVRVTERKSSFRIYYSSRIVSHLMANLFGDHVLRKHVPNWFLTLHESSLWHFLDAALLGDGCLQAENRRIDYSTSSLQLFHQMRCVIHKLGFSTHTQSHKPRKSTWNTRHRIYISGEQIERFSTNLPVSGPRIELVNPGNGGIQRMSHVDSDFVYMRVTKVRNTSYKGLVYDFSVDEDTSYVAEHIVVSNSPPGYLGHRETHPRLTQETLNMYHKDNMKMSFVLFDEIEKSSDALWQLLLGIMDKAILTLGDNRKVDFSSSMIFLTSNLGGREISELFESGIGFPKPADKVDNKIQGVSARAIRKRFSPEFINRIDRTVVFNPLTTEQLETILQLELDELQLRILSGNKGIAFGTTEELRKFLLKEGADTQYGARHIKRAIQKHIVFPLSGLITSGQIKPGEVLSIDFANNEVEFTKVPLLTGLIP